jgi:DNA-binding CsgD family transcriptional regulator
MRLKFFSRGALNMISKEEKAIVRLILCGHTDEQARKTLGMSQHSYWAHLDHIFAELHVRNRVELLLLAYSRQGESVMQQVAA